MRMDRPAGTLPSSKKTFAVLYIEAEWTTCRLAQWIMQDVPAVWTYASSDGDACDLLKQMPGSFDVVIVDHHPLKNADWPVVQSLRKTGYAGSIIVLAMCALPASERADYEPWNVSVVEFDWTGTQAAEMAHPKN